jgi:hypothetical protein
MDNFIISEVYSYTNEYGSYTGILIEIHGSHLHFNTIYDTFGFASNAKGLTPLSGRASEAPGFKKCDYSEQEKLALILKYT